MKVGVDVRSMQIGHQFRGIGQVLLGACRQLDARLPADAELVLFADPAGPGVQDLLAGTVDDARPTVVVRLPPPRRGRLQKLVRGGFDAAQEDIVAASCDLFVQLDFSLGVPERTPAVLFVHDLIPLLLADRFPDQYRPSYRTARRAGRPRRESVRQGLRRAAYVRSLSCALANADGVLANSQHTAAAITRFAATRGLDAVQHRLTVTPLGHEPPPPEQALDAVAQARVEALGLGQRPFLFFMGGADARRRIDLLVTAFNHLRAEGMEIDLVLAGYDFRFVEALFTPSARAAVETSSYRSDIHLLGFVSPAERGWLFRHAEAYVFPSEHEGFGLPVVEALAAGCTVVAFSTTSMPELVGPNVYLCPPTWPALRDEIRAVIARPADRRERDASTGEDWAGTFTWDALGRALMDHVDQPRGKDHPRQGSIWADARMLLRTGRLR